MAEAFAGCPLTHHVTFGDKLERIRKAAFRSCKSLKSITIPLKEDMLGIVEMPFYDCDKLERVDIVESLHKAIAAFQFEEWTDDMNLEVSMEVFFPRHPIMLDVILLRGQRTGRYECGLHPF
mmetsp:Transcript_8365/g.16950  ORF Transcript_8365/g.16950 Transcript_8365/m.16950 type:complete len:122 (-) Transcript_8365:153-518(-)